MMATFVGWVVILGALFRMFSPEVRQAAQNSPTTTITANLVGAIGLFLTFKAGSEQDGE
jgi:fluoride ion exporter CrcB/FEX